MNYGCSTGVVGNAAVKRFKSVIEEAKSSANEKIEDVKDTKNINDESNLKSEETIGE